MQETNKYRNKSLHLTILVFYAQVWGVCVPGHGTAPWAVTYLWRHVRVDA
jgi:hypothetical protein